MPPSWRSFEARKVSYGYGAETVETVEGRVLSSSPLTVRTLTDSYASHFTEKSYEAQAPNAIPPALGRTEITNVNANL
eukprot:4796439-Amphidinium_carterae.1